MAKIYWKNTESLHVHNINAIDEISFVSDSQDVAPIKEELGEIGAEYDSFFAHVRDGEVIAYYGMEGIVPVLSKRLDKLELIHE